MHAGEPTDSTALLRLAINQHQSSNKRKREGKNLQNEELFALMLTLHACLRCSWCSQCPRSSKKHKQKHSQTDLMDVSRIRGQFGELELFHDYSQRHLLLQQPLSAIKERLRHRDRNLVLICPKRDLRPSSPDMSRHTGPGGRTSLRRPKCTPIRATRIRQVK